MKYDHFYMQVIITQYMLRFFVPFYFESIVYAVVEFFLKAFLHNKKMFLHIFCDGP